MLSEVTCVIPGASNADQAKANTFASGAEPLTQEQMQKVKKIYDKYIKNPVHYLW
jgi:aryl-alcohol dehydrogenase-like predicted oxidoreductase